MTGGLKRGEGSKRVREDFLKAIFISTEMQSILLANRCIDLLLFHELYGFNVSFQ